jgi:Glyoxalase-like domain
MSATDGPAPRLRQAVLAATDLDATVIRLRESLSLGEPFSDPAVATFGLRNAVFAIGDTFLEVISPVREHTAAGRLLERRGGDCGYMAMFQVADLAAARARSSARGIREVFEVELSDMSEVHLHPADIGGAIVSLSAPQPPDSWRWGGPDWAGRSLPGAITGISVGVRDPDAVGERWRAVIGSVEGVRFVADEHERGPIEVLIERPGAERATFEIAGVRLAVC